VVVLAMGILLLAATFAGAALSALGSFVSDLLPGGAILWQVVNYLITLAILTLVFGVIFKMLPTVEIAWSDVWPGAALTALFFVVGQLALGWYLGRQSGASVYGAAGSLIVLLLWIYYSAQIFLFGAEYTQVYASRYGKGVRPAADAVPRGSEAPPKAAARSAQRSQLQPASNGGVKRREVARLATTWQLAVDSGKDLSSLGRLATSVVADWRTLVVQEVRLARAELREALARGGRGLAMSAGGGLLLYAAALLLAAMIAILLQLIMPAWLAALLVGLLLLVEGWLIMVWARQKLRASLHAPREAAQSVREDVETVKAHLVR
jgi:hypothetical protein